MAKRQTDEERAVIFFQTADFLIAKTTFNIIKGVMKIRIAAEDTDGRIQPVKTRKPRGKNKPKPTGPVSTDTAVSAGAA